MENKKIFYKAPWADNKQQRTDFFGRLLDGLGLTANNNLSKYAFVGAAAQLKKPRNSEEELRCTKLLIHMYGKYQYESSPHKFRDIKFLVEALTSDMGETGVGEYSWAFDRYWNKNRKDAYRYLKELHQMCQPEEIVIIMKELIKLHDKRVYPLLFEQLSLLPAEYQLEAFKGMFHKADKYEDYSSRSYDDQCLALAHLIPLIHNEEDRLEAIRMTFEKGYAREKDYCFSMLCSIPRNRIFPIVKSYVSSLSNASDKQEINIASFISSNWDAFSEQEKMELVDIGLQYGGQAFVDLVNDKMKEKTPVLCRRIFDLLHLKGNIGNDDPRYYQYFSNYNSYAVRIEAARWLLEIPEHERTRKDLEEAASIIQSCLPNYNEIGLTKRAYELGLVWLREKIRPGLEEIVFGIITQSSSSKKELRQLALKADYEARHAVFTFSCREDFESFGRNLRHGLCPLFFVRTAESFSLNEKKVLIPYALNSGYDKARLAGVKWVLEVPEAEREKKWMEMSADAIMENLKSLKPFWNSKIEIKKLEKIELLELVNRMPKVYWRGMGLTDTF